MAILFCYSPGYGQAKFSFGITLGYATTGMSSHPGDIGSGSGGGYGYTYTYKGVSYPFLGLVSNFRVTDQIRIQPELLIQAIGSKTSEEGFGHFTTTIIYLKIPIDAMYNVKAGPGYVEAGLGPYFSKALTGESGGKTMKFGSNPNNDNATGGDYGLDLRVEYIFNIGAFLSLSYDDGLANIYPGGSSGGTNHTYSTNISIGILFGFKSKHNGDNH